MTINDIYSEVALLGFENDIDEEATFLPALNRALHSVLREVPTVRSAVLAHYPPTPLVSESHLTIHGGEGLSYKTEGAKTFYIEIAGTGSVSFKLYDDKGFSIPHSLDFKYPLFSESAFGYEARRSIITGNGGVLPKRVEVYITANTLSRVRSIAMYDEATSENKDDIPAPSKYITYDLKRVIADYGRMCEQPMLADETLVTDYVLEGDCLMLPRDITGDVIIAYHPAIPTYTADDANKELPIGNDLKGALVYLIASCVWLDDNNDRSQYYKTLYNEEIVLVARDRRELNITRYESVNNW